MSESDKSAAQFERALWEMTLEPDDVAGLHRASTDSHCSRVISKGQYTGLAQACQSVCSLRRSHVSLTRTSLSVSLTSLARLSHVSLARDEDQHCKPPRPSDTQHPPFQRTREGGYRASHQEEESAAGTHARVSRRTHSKLE
jgi:hypothetical protein